MKLLCIFLITLGLHSQTCTVDAPTASQVVSSIVTLKGHCTGATNPVLYSLEYIIADEANQYIAYASNGFQFPWNSTDLYNGDDFTIHAIGRDLFGNTIFDSLNGQGYVHFKVANPHPNLDPLAGYGNPAPSITTSLGATIPTPCTGTISIPLVITNATAGELAAGITISINVGGSDPTKAYTTVTSATPTVTLNCARFYNGSHLVAIVAKAGDKIFGQAKQALTFSNGAANIEITSQSRRVYLQNVNDTYQIQPVYQHADHSTPTALGGAAIYTIKNVALGQGTPACITVSSTGLVTLVSTCIGSEAPYGIVSVTDGTLTEELIYFFWLNGLKTLHFRSNGSITDTWQGDGTDVWLGCIFFNASEVSSTHFDFPDRVAASGYAGDPTYHGYEVAAEQAGVNCFEGGGSVGALASFATAQINFQRDTMRPTASLMAVNPDKFFVPVWIGYIEGNDVAFYATQGPAASFITPLTTYLSQEWANPTMQTMYIVECDECNYAMGTDPAGPLIQMSGGGALTKIVAKIMRVSASTSVAPAISGGVDGQGDCNAISSYTASTQITYTIPVGGTTPNSCVLRINADGTGDVHVPTDASRPVRNVGVGSDWVIPAGTKVGVIWNTIGNLYDQIANVRITTGSVGTVSWAIWQSGCEANNFLIRNATSANINSTIGTNHYTRLNIDSQTGAQIGDWDAPSDRNHFWFVPPAAIVADTLYNFSSDPTLQIEKDACWWMHPTNGTTDATGDNPGGGAAGQYTGFLPHNWGATLMTQANAASPARPAASFPDGGHTPASAQYHWMSDPAFSGASTGARSAHIGLATFFFASANGPLIIDATHQSQGFDMKTATASFGGEIDWRPNIMQQPRAFLMEVGGVTNNWTQGGYDKGVTSCTNEVCTIPSHLVANIIPGVTRLQIKNSSNSAYNSTFFFVRCLDANTCLIANSAYTPSNLGSNVVADQGVIHWEDGTTSTLGNSGTALGYGTSSFIPGANASNGCVVFSKINQIFSVTNSGDTNVNALRFWYAGDSISIVPASGLCTKEIWRPLPSGSTAGGTAYIIPDNYYHSGFTPATGGGSFNGPRQAFYNIPWAASLGAAGVRSYTSGTDQQRFDKRSGYPGTIYAAQNALWSGGTAIQAGPHPVYCGADQCRQWYAIGYGMRDARRGSKYEYQLKSLGPQGADYGQLFDSGNPVCGAGIGCALDYFNLSDDTYTITTPSFLTACGGSSCKQSGQKILRELSEWNGVHVTELAATTNSDAPSMPPGSHVRYLFPLNEAAEYQTISVSARLADVSAATGYAVRWGYDTWSLDQRTDQTTDCGIGPCSLPADKAFGTIYYRILYYDTNKKVLATSDVETLGDSTPYTVPIYSCQTISASGTYLVSANLTTATNPCINIQNTSNVVLDCGGHTVNGVVSGLGVPTIQATTNVSNVTIQNCNVNNEIAMQGDGMTAQFNTIYTSRSLGVPLTVSFGNNDTIQFNVLNGNSVSDTGLSFGPGNGALIRGNGISSTTGLGIELFGIVNSNKFISNSMTNNNGGIGGFLGISLQNNTFSYNVATNGPEIFNLVRTNGAQMGEPPQYFSGNSFDHNVLANSTSPNTRGVDIEMTTPASGWNFGIGNTFTKNDFGKGVGSIPVFNPYSMIVDGGGNVFDCSAVPGGYPLVCN